ncbi:BA75_03400T0 [Komagataella pastoris]|uniref:Presequence protease, mitochondrial n=1 Tax=Komagataella pastoris TaxID=4922 RepID=A0A1B2JEQ4_PICPA|nr:BA75_03400T0 [Komagataella pastoris]
MFSKVKISPLLGPHDLNIRARFLSSLSNYNTEKMMGKYKVDSIVHGFKVSRVLPVPELALTAVELVHQRTGCKHLHIDKEDRNNTFSIIFKTNPPNHTGVPHILEHTTLCGSAKYPVRDPFFKMLNRSLSSFMNAMTAHDHTLYPFCTTNKADFENLMDVYLDSTLRPLLLEEDFLQEGWRLENETYEDKSSPLVFKGVVYNEMKGQMSDSSYYFWINFQNAIYPSLQNSGGDPKYITDLKYSDLVEFHGKNYHPSNAKVYTYGNFPLTDHLARIDAAFTGFGRRGQKSDVKVPINLNSVKEVVTEGPVDTMVNFNKQFKTSLSWYVGRPSDIYETFLLRILSSLIIDGHSSILHQKLIETGLASDFSINTGMESMSNQNIFTLGLSGITEETSINLQSLLADILQEVKEKGISSKRVKAIIHQLELAKKVHTADFGMNMLQSLIPGWVNNVDPFEQLEWNKLMLKFNNDYEKKGKRLFTDLLDKYLIGKPYLKFTMKPHKELSYTIEKEESERLQAHVDKLDEDDKSIIFQRGINLSEKQDAEEDLSCLPTLTIDDIARYSQTQEALQTSYNGSQVFKRVSNKANGLTYFGLSKRLNVNMPPELLKLLPLFSDCLTYLGTTSQEMHEIEEEIKLYTGGLMSGVSINASPYNIKEPVLKFGISGMSMDQNFYKVIEIWTKLLLNTNFRNERKLSSLIRNLTSDNMSSLVGNGHLYARSVSSSKISPVKQIDELLNGVEQIQFLNQLNEWDSQGVLRDKVIPQLEKLQEVVVNGFNMDNFKVSLLSGKESIVNAESQIKQLLDLLNSSNCTSEEFETRHLNHEFVPASKTYISVPSQVAFSSLSLAGVPYVNEDGAALQILSQLFTFKHLHKEIREKGGAYGGGSGYDGLNGVFHYYSYRDPNPAESLATFKSSPHWLLESMSHNHITEQDLDQAKLTIFQRVDAPQSLKDEGQLCFSYGIDEDMKQIKRQQLLDVELSDIKKVAEEYLVNSAQSQAVIGGDGYINKNEGWDTINM